LDFSFNRRKERSVAHSSRSKSGSFCKVLVAALGAFTMIWVLLMPEARAIPYFARKYETACSTCHKNFPELNDFGEAFKKNGWKFPKDDDVYVKQPPVLLGAPAQRQVFPNVVYPGEIPATIPIAFRLNGFLTYNSKQPPGLASENGFVPRTDLFAPDAFTIIAAGTLGDPVSFWVDDDLAVGGSGADGGMGDGYLRFNDLGHYIGLPRNALNLRFGQFELDLPFSQARTINPTDYDVYGQASAAGSLGTTDNPFIFGASQRGFEIGGYPNNGNFGWSVALVNGNNDAPADRNFKDVYFRISNQFNLERDPAIRKEVQAAGPTGPRDHTSIRVGGFYYYGRNALNVDGSLYPTFGTIHEPFYRVGGDLRFKYRKLEVYGLMMYGRDQNLIPDEDTGFLLHGSPVTFTGGFAEAEYWIYPWLIGIMRYDAVNSPTDYLNGASRHNTRNRFSPGFQILIRDNIKTVFEFQRNWEQPTETENVYYRPNSFVAGIDYLF
jgi:hypothetical protein